jgi:hypothetical protein
VRVVDLFWVVHPPAAVAAFVAHGGWQAAAVVEGEWSHSVLHLVELELVLAVFACHFPALELVPFVVEDESGNVVLRVMVWTSKIIRFFAVWAFNVQAPL